MNFAIRVDNITFSYEQTFLLEHCSLSITEGSLSFLFGPNGAGKTTLFKVIAGVYKPQSGTISLANTLLTDLSHREIAKKVALLEQDCQYVFPFSVEEIVLMGRFPHAQGKMFESHKDEEKALWAMERTQTLPFRRRSIFTLSGGERRRVEIARALAQEADIMLLDEPTVFLDVKQQEDLFTLIQELNREKKITFLIVSHQLEFIRDYADAVYFMQDGHIEQISDKTILDSKQKVIAQFK